MWDMQVTAYLHRLSTFMHILPSTVWSALCLPWFAMVCFCSSVPALAKLPEPQPPDHTPLTNHTMGSCLWGHYWVLLGLKVLLTCLEAAEQKTVLVKALGSCCLIDTNTKHFKDTPSV
jgi:hypothetical protein